VHVSCDLLKEGELLEHRHTIRSQQGTTNILRTCQQIYQEAQPVLYDQMHFRISLRPESSQLNTREMAFELWTKPMRFLVPLMRSVSVNLNTTIYFEAMPGLNRLADLFERYGGEAKIVWMDFSTGGYGTPQSRKKLVIELEKLAASLDDASKAKEMYSHVARSLRLVTE
jgi:hypothetical protein